MPDAVRVMHPITRLIVGGAQQNTILTVAGLRRAGYEASIVVGPQTGSEGELFTEAQRTGVPVTLVGSLVREVHPAKDLVALLALVRLFRRERPTIVHTHSSKAGVLGRIAARLARVPIIVHTIHGWSFNPRQPWHVRWTYTQAERLCAAVTDCLIAVSTDDVEEGRRLRIGKPDRYTVIRSGIDIERYASPTTHVDPAELGIPCGAPVVGTVARLSPQKCPTDFVTAARAIADQVPEATFVYVGDGPLRPGIERLVASVGLQGQFRLLGLRDDVPELLQLFDVFVSTSLWEGLPRTFLQAMAAGKPIVSTDVSGARDVLRHEVTGFVVPARDPQALAECVVRLLRQPGLARMMGSSGRARLTGEFSARAMVDRIGDVYERLIAARRE